MSAADVLRRVPIHRSLNRPDLLAGCERELILLTVLIASTLIVVALNLLAAITGVLIWSGLVVVLRAMAKADPFMSKVYIRHIRYGRYYSAHSSVYAPGAIKRRDK